MMKKTLSILFLGILISTAAAAQSSQQDVIEVEGEISQEDKNFYPEQQIIEFPAVKSGEETVRYSNASYEEYVSWQLKDKGLQKIRSRINSDLSLKNIRTGSTAGNIEVTYIDNESIERNFSYQQLQDIIPSKISGSYEIREKTVNTTVDVILKSRESSPAQDQLGYSVARSSESFGSSTREDYKANFDILNTTQGEHAGEQVKNVSVSEDSISFTGYVELGQPCDKINRTYVQEDSELILKVNTYSTGEPCVDVIAFKKYSFDIESEKPVRLEVRHDGQEVRSLETVGTHADEPGIVEDIVNLIKNLILAI